MQQECQQLQCLETMTSTLYVSVMQTSSHHLEYAGRSQGRNDVHQLQWRQEMQACIKGNHIMARL